jgi:hypothetical protein
MVEYLSYDQCRQVDHPTSFYELDPSVYEFSKEIHLLSAPNIIDSMISRTDAKASAYSGGFINGD